MLEGTSSRGDVKHVVIDEMQDYTPVQYQVLAALYPTKMTILGDRNQSVNPFSSSSAETIRDVLPEAECVYMTKSYRSTLEITNVAQAIIHNPDLIPIERHGEPPRFHAFPTKSRELEFLLERTRAFAENDHNSLGIICKTQQQAESVYKCLQDEANVRLIDTESNIFSGGVIISTAYLAKGLEFDEILVPFCNEREYGTAIDRHMLYVAVTRAMHTLTITHTGTLTPFLHAAAGV